MDTFSTGITSQNRSDPPKETDTSPIAMSSENCLGPPNETHTSRVEITPENYSPTSNGTDNFTVETALESCLAPLNETDTLLTEITSQNRSDPPKETDISPIAMSSENCLGPPNETHTSRVETTLENYSPTSNGTDNFTIETALESCLAPLNKRDTSNSEMTSNKCSVTPNEQHISNISSLERAPVSFLTGADETNTSFSEWATKKISTIPEATSSSATEDAAQNCAASSTGKITSPVDFTNCRLQNTERDCSLLIAEADEGNIGDVISQERRNNVETFEMYEAITRGEDRDFQDCSLQSFENRIREPVSQHPPTSLLDSRSQSNTTGSNSSCINYSSPEDVRVQITEGLSDDAVVTGSFPLIDEVEEEDSEHNGSFGSRESLNTINCPNSNCGGWGLLGTLDDAQFRCNLCGITYCMTCNRIYQPVSCVHLNQTQKTSTSENTTKNRMNESSGSSEGTFGSVSAEIANMTVVAERNSLPMGFLVSEYNRMAEELNYANADVFDSLWKRRGEIESEIINIKKIELQDSAVVRSERDEFLELVSIKITNPRSEKSFMYKHHSQAINHFYGLLHHSQPNFTRPGYPQNFPDLGLTKIIRAFYHDNSSLRSVFEAEQTLMEKKYNSREESAPIWAYHGTSREAADLIFKNNFNLDCAKRFQFGRGIYLSEYPQKAMHYSPEVMKCSSFEEEHMRIIPYKVLILCKVLPGKPTTEVCASNNSTSPEQNEICNCDSHIQNQDDDGRGVQLVIFNTNRILPVYELHVSKTR